MKPISAALLFAICVGSAGHLGAQTVRTAGTADPGPALKRQLRDLVTAQESYWHSHGTYTTDVAALGMFKAGPPSGTDSVWVQVVQAGGRSWWGRAVHRAHRGKSCVIYVGMTEDFTMAPTTDTGAVKAEREGDPACDPLGG